MGTLRGAPGAAKTIASNSGWLLAHTAIRMAISLVTAVWLTRYLGPESFGLYSYVIALVMIFVAVSSVGMNSLVTRELVERPDDRNSILGSALAVRAVGSLIAVIILVAVTFALHPDADYRVALIVFGSVLFFQPLGVVSLFYEAQTRSRYVVFVNLGAAIAYLAAVAVFIALDLSVTWFLGARLFEVIVIQIGVVGVFAFHGYRPTKMRLVPSQARSLIGEAWPLVASAVGAALYLRIDQVMLGQLTTAAEVGFYAAAARLSEIWYIVPGLIVASAFPYLLKLREKSPERYPTRLQQLYDLLFWSGFGLAVVTTLAAPWVIDLLYGAEYAPSSSILRIHIWAGVFIFMRAAFSKWLIAERLLTFSLVTQGAGAIVNILINLAFIPLWGGIGAAWATVISYAAASYFALWIFPPTRPAAGMMTKTIGAPVRYMRHAGRTSHG